MRHCIFILTLLAFLMTSVGSLALANTCMGMDMTSSVSTEYAMTDMNGDLDPCHEEPNKEQSTTDHCDGICLCMSITISKAPLPSADQLPLPILTLEAYAFNDEGVKPWHTSPLFKPPIQNS